MKRIIAVSADDPVIAILRVVCDEHAERARREPTTPPAERIVTGEYDGPAPCSWCRAGI